MEVEVKEQIRAGQQVQQKKTRAVFCVFSMAGTGCRGIVGFSLNSASIIWHENSKFKSD